MDICDKWPQTMASGCQMRYFANHDKKGKKTPFIHSYIYIRILLNGVFVMSTAIQYTEFGNFSFWFSKRQLINQRLFASNGNENPITSPLYVSFTLLISKPQLFISVANFLFPSHYKCVLYVHKSTPWNRSDEQTWETEIILNTLNMN